MLDSNIFEVFKYFFVALSLIFILSVVFVIMQMQSLTSFSHYAGNYISNVGGVTSQVATTLNTYADNHYAADMKIIPSSSTTGTVDNGQEIDYTVRVTIANPMAPDLPLKAERTYVTYSKVSDNQ